jgi:2-polyprenyl-6-methoxyphenol hydroxylase-like FAD-dependent oxidoreductase
MIDILVVGAGPVGLTLAAELARHGARCRIIDQRPEPSPYCRAIGVTPRTLEVWEDMGIAREMIDAGLWLEGTRTLVHGQATADEMCDFADLPYWELGIPQNETERVLTRHLATFGITVERGVKLAAMRQDAGQAVATLDHSGGLREEIFCAYLIGCDGAHSTVRNAAGIGFEGDAFPAEFMLADVRIGWDLPRGLMLRALRLAENSAPEMFIAVPLPQPNRYRVSTLCPPDLASPSTGTDHGIQSERPAPDLERFQAVADSLVPGKPPLSDLRWSSIFRISMRLAARYREGRVFIGGDAAHIHPPTGGQGMNTGIHDAYNLAWKLALVVNGISPADLLDSYESERRPVATEVIAHTREASLQIGRRRETNRLADSQILVTYRGTDWVRDDGGAAALQAGDRAPDCLRLRRFHVGFPMRLFDVLRGTEHVLLVALEPSLADAETGRLQQFAAAMRSPLGSCLRIAAIAPAGATVQQIDGVPVLQDTDGNFARLYGHGAYLVRPDGYIGWRGPSWADPGLTAHLRRLFINFQ